MTPTSSTPITDADRRAAAVLAQWMIELGLDQDMLSVAQEGFEYHLAVHRSTYAEMAVEAARKDWKRDWDTFVAFEEELPPQEKP